MIGNLLLPVLMLLTIYLADNVALLRGTKGS